MCWRNTMLNVELFEQQLKKLHMTQKEVAQKLGVAQSTIIYWKNGRNSASGENQQKLADLLHVNMRDLFLYSDEKNAPVPKDKIKHSEFYSKLLTAAASVSNLCSELETTEYQNVGLTEREIIELRKKSEIYFAYVWDVMKRNM